MSTAAEKPAEPSYNSEKLNTKKSGNTLGRFTWGIYRFFRYLLIWIAILIVLLLMVIFYFTATNSGYKTLPTLIEKFTPYTVQFSELEGTLFQPQIWRNVTVRGPEVDFQADTVKLSWNSHEIWKKRFLLNQLSVEKAHIDLLPSIPKEKPKSESITKLPDISLPIQIDIEQIALDQIEITQEGQPILNVEQAHLSAHLKDNEITAQGNLISNKVSGDWQGKVIASGKYPIDLTLNMTTPLIDPSQQMNLHWEKSVLDPNIYLTLSGAVAADASLQGNIDLGAETLTANLNWSDIDYQNTYQSKNGQLHINGKFDALTTTLKMNFQAPDLPLASLDFSALIHPKNIDNAKITLQALGGEAHFIGDVDYSDGVAWNGIFDISNIDARKFSPNLDLHLNGSIRTNGKQQGEALQAFAGIDALSGSWQGQPISGKGNIIYENQKLNIDDLQLTLAGNTILATGAADQENADLNLKLNAPMLGKLVPDLTGAVNGQAHVTGSLADPQIESQFSWQDLRYGVKNPLFTSKNGKLTAIGNLETVAINLSGQAEGKDFPPMTLTASADLNPTEKLENLQLKINTLKGEILATGVVSYAPIIEWDIHTNAKNIDPHYFSPDLDASVNATVHSKGKIVDGTPQLIAVIDSLGGRWQKQALTGAGTVKINGDQIKTEKLFVNVGGNRVQIDGGLQGKNLAADFVIDGKKLNVFYPSLGGSLTGKGKISGAVNNPHIETQLQGRNIIFQDNKIAALNINLNSALQKGSSFNNSIALQGVSAGGQNWKMISVETRGQFEQHRLNVKTTGSKAANIELAAEGGFSAIDSWKGILSSLKLNAYDTNWQLQQPSAIAFSPKEITVKNFCLKDVHSGLCVDLAKAKKTTIHYQIKQLSPHSFAKFIPNDINVKTALTGSGEVTISESGQLHGTTNLQLTPGSVSVYAENQPPLTVKIREAHLRSEFSNRAAKSDLNIDLGDSGVIKGEALLSDYQKQNITGQLTVNIPRLAQFKKFIPKVSELNGNINGTMQFTGTVKKPIISGDIALTNGVVKIPEYATDLNNISLNLAAHRTGQIDITGNIGTPEGNLTTNGNLFLSPLKLNLKMSGKNMLIANSKDMKIHISPDFTIVINPQTGVNVTGKLLIPQARISLPDTTGAQSISEDVVILNDKNREAQPITTDPSNPVTANIEVRLGNQVYFTNNKIKIRLNGGIDVAVRPGRPVTAQGTIEVASGVYELYGQELDVRRGRVSFAGGDITNPIVDVLALREIGDAAVGASVKGAVRNLQLKLTSQPPMPDSVILSYLLFGHPPDGAVDGDALLQMAASLSIGQILPNDLAEQTGLDVFDLGVSGLKAGKYLTKDLYLGMKNDFFTGVTEFIARYQFTNRFNVEATAKQQSQSIDFLYEFETN